MLKSADHSDLVRQANFLGILDIISSDKTKDNRIYFTISKITIN